jgi:hypothetical protein
VDTSGQLARSREAQRLQEQAPLRAREDTDEGAVCRIVVHDAQAPFFVVPHDRMQTRGCRILQREKEGGAGRENASERRPVSDVVGGAERTLA